MWVGLIVVIAVVAVCYYIDPISVWLEAEFRALLIAWIRYGPAKNVSIAPAPDSGYALIPRGDAKRSRID